MPPMFQPIKKTYWKIWGFQRTTDFSRNCFEEVSLKTPQGLFSKKLVGKNRFKMIFEKCLPCFNHKKYHWKIWGFQRTTDFSRDCFEEVFLKNPPGLFQKDLLEKIDWTWSLKNASRVSTHKKNYWKIWGFQRTTDFSRDCFEEVFLKNPPGLFQKDLLEKIDLKWSLKNASRVSTHKKNILKNLRFSKNHGFFKKLFWRSFFEKSTRSFSKRLVGKNRFKMVFEKCLPCFNP